MYVIIEIRGVYLICDKYSNMQETTQNSIQKTKFTSSKNFNVLDNKPHFLEAKKRMFCHY